MGKKHGRKELAKAMAEIDLDGNDEVSFPEFSKWLTSVEETERRLEEGTLALEPVCPMRAGDIFVRNPHCVHRGSASERDARRPMLAYIFTKPSHFASWSLRTHAISERVLGSLEPDVQRMLRMIPRAGAEAELLQGYNSGEDMAQELAKL